MLRPFFPELVMSTDLLSFEHPSVLQFSLKNAITLSSNNHKIMDILLSGYGMIFTEFDNIDPGRTEVNTTHLVKSYTIFTE